MTTEWKDIGVWDPCHTQSVVYESRSHTPFLIFSACSFHCLTSFSLTSLQRQHHTHQHHLHFWTFKCFFNQLCWTQNTELLDVLQTPQLTPCTRPRVCIFQEGNLRTYIRTTFFTLKFSSGAASGSWPLSFCKTICWTMRSSSSQYCTVFPLLLSAGKQDKNTERHTFPISPWALVTFSSAHCGFYCPSQKRTTTGGVVWLWWNAKK